MHVRAQLRKLRILTKCPRVTAVVRMQRVAEEVLPDSQCGFRAGRGCVDMVFCARQLVEKAREHNATLYLLFVDLRKAYDSVPREALWHVLRKCMEFLLP